MMNFRIPLKLTLKRLPIHQTFWRGGMGLVMLAGLLLALNSIASFVSVRMDLSSGKLYSLSKASRKLLSQLQDPLTIKVYFSQGLPEPYSTNARYVKELLGEYRVWGKGKIKMSFPNQNDREKFKEDAVKTGISPINFTSIAKDQFQVQEGFMGLAMSYRGKQEIIPVIKDAEGIEYDLSSRIKLLTATSKKSIGFTVDHGEHGIWNIAPEIRSHLEKLYEIKTIDLDAATTPQIPADMLCIIGPAKPFEDKHLFLIDQYVMSGKPAAILMDRRQINLQAFWTTPLNTGLEPLLASYGLHIPDAFVLDAQCQRISITSQQGFFRINNILDYPLIPLATDLNKANPIVKDLEVVAFPFASPLISSAATGITTIKPLAQSSALSWQNNGMSYVNPLKLPPKNPADSAGPFVLAGIIDGKLNSHFVGKALPENIKNTTRLDSTDKARLVVTGTSHIIDADMGISPQNFSFFLNTLDWMAQDTDLLSIRSKGSAYRPLKTVSPMSRQLIKTLGVLFLPCMAGVAGLIRWRLRKRWRQKITASFSPS